VTFVVGQSQESKDWNFAQWGWYVRQPYWGIRFNQPAASRGTATLTLSFASFIYPKGLQVRLNDQEVGRVKLPKSGMAAYRCGGQDSLRQTVYLTFDASLIKRGANELQLALIDAVPFDPASDTNPSKVGAVMYDALRLEVNSNRKFIASAER
jgi:rhamnogalacturonan endolyase